MNKDKGQKISSKNNEGCREEKEKPLDLKKRLEHDIVGLDFYPQKCPKPKKAS